MVYDDCNNDDNLTLSHLEDKMELEGLDKGIKKSTALINHISEEPS